MSSEVIGLRAAIYDRVSQDRRGSGRSVTEQSAANRQACTERQWDVVDEYTDNDRSASRFARKGRPDWERLVADLAAGKFDVLVLWESSRGSRDLAVWAALLDACRDRGVQIHVTSDGRSYDPRIARDWRSLAEDGVDSGYESEKTAKRINRTVQAQAAKGLPHGRIPFGYRREYDPTTGALLRQVPDEKTAPLIREMAKRARSGEPLNQIAVDLNQRGVPTPTGRPWELSRVRQIITNPTIAGLRVFRGEVLEDVQAAWEPILPPDEFWALHAKLTDPRRRTYSDGSVKHLLVNIARCGVCGAKCRLLKNRGVPSYGCSAGFHVVRAQWLVDEWVADNVIARLERPDAWDLLATDDSEDIAAARAEAAGLRARLDAFCDSAAEGKLTPTALERIEARLRPQIEAADKRARAATTTPLVGELIGERARERWDALSVPQRREVVRALLTPVIHRTVQGRKRDFSSIEIRWHSAE